MSSFSPSPLRSRTGTMPPLDPIIIFLGGPLLSRESNPGALILGLFVDGPSAVQFVTTQEGCHMKGGSKLRSLAMVL